MVCFEFTLLYSALISLHILYYSYFILSKDLKSSRTLATVSLVDGYITMHYRAAYCYYDQVLYILK